MTQQVIKIIYFKEKGRKMPHYSIPVNKTILCWAEIDFEGTLEEAIEKLKVILEMD